jgi:hypothetical protein
MKKATIIIAVLEAMVLLVMKLMDWKESKSQKPAAGKARKVGGRRVVNPSPQSYNARPPEGDSSAINFLAGSSATDEKIHEED